MTPYRELRRPSVGLFEWGGLLSGHLLEQGLFWAVSVLERWLVRIAGEEISRKSWFLVGLVGIEGEVGAAVEFLLGMVGKRS